MISQGLIQVFLDLHIGLANLLIGSTQIIVCLLNLNAGVDKIGCQAQRGHKGRRKQGDQPAHAVLPLALPQVIIPAAQECGCQPGQFNTLGLSRLHPVIAAQWLPVLGQDRRYHIVRLAFRQHDQNPLNGVGLQEQLDLPHAPLRLLESGRADHDEIVRIHQRLIDIIGEIYRQRQLLFIPENTVNLLDTGNLLNGLRDLEPLQLPVDPLGDLGIQRAVPIGDKRVKMCGHGVTSFFLFYVITISQEQVIGKKSRLKQPAFLIEAVPTGLPGSR